MITSLRELKNYYVILSVEEFTEKMTKLKEILTPNVDKFFNYEKWKWLSNLIIEFTSSGMYLGKKNDEVVCLELGGRFICVSESRSTSYLWASNTQILTATTTSGVSPHIAFLIVLILEDMYGVEFPDLHRVVSPDVDIFEKVMEKVKKIMEGSKLQGFYYSNLGYMTLNKKVKSREFEISKVEIKKLSQSSYYHQDQIGINFNLIDSSDGKKKCNLQEHLGWRFYLTSDLMLEDKEWIKKIWLINTTKKAESLNYEIKREKIKLKQLEADLDRYSKHLVNIDETINKILGI